MIPELDDFRPTGEHQTPLERVDEWIETTDPDSGKPARRDPNTMPQWAGSCWYFLRFCDPNNADALISEEAEQYWMPVDLYVGGAEHAVLHLLYSRFWHKFLYDLGVVHTKEPFQKLVNQGMILGSSFRYYDDNLGDDPNATAQVYSSEQVVVGEDGARAKEDGRELKARWVGPGDVARAAGPERLPFHPAHDDLVLEEVVEKMSKSRGNVINPDDVVAEFGADSMRLYEMFIGPLDKDAPWSTDGIQGVFRFLQRAWRLFHEGEGDAETLRTLAPGAGSEAQARLVATTVQACHRRPRGDAVQHRHLEAHGLRSRHRQGRAAPGRRRRRLPAAARTLRAASGRGALAAPRTRRHHQLRSLARGGPGAPQVMPTRSRSPSR